MLELILKIVAVLGGLGAIFAPVIYFIRKRDNKIDELETELDELREQFLEYQNTALTIFRLKDDCLNLHKVDDFQRLLKIIKGLKDNDEQN